MNEFEKPSDMQLNRLVDDEMSESERRELLNMLAREDCEETCGWRRLALTFVEAQSLRHEMRRMVPRMNWTPDGFTKIDHDLGETSKHTGDQPRRALSSTLKTWSYRVVALVACCLAGFGIGRISTVDDHELTQTQFILPSTATHTDDVSPDFDDAFVATASHDGEQIHQTLRLILDDLTSGSSVSVDVPIVSAEDIDPTDYLRAPPSIPISVQQKLLRSGHVVRENRQLIEVQLSDGRRGFVPISDVTVFDEGMDVFQ